MWQKVTSINQLNHLKIGAVLTKYPVIDEPVETFEDANTQNSDLRIVKRNDNELQEIDFVPDEQKIETSLALGINSVTLNPIYKTYLGVINDGRYWINE
jgi:hypothetical protein